MPIVARLLRAGLRLADWFKAEVLRVYTMLAEEPYTVEIRNLWE